MGGGGEPDAGMVNVSHCQCIVWTSCSPWWPPPSTVSTVCAAAAVCDPPARRGEPARGHRRARDGNAQGLHEDCYAAHNDEKPLYATAVLTSVRDRRSAADAAGGAAHPRWGVALYWWRTACIQMDSAGEGDGNDWCSEQENGSGRGVTSNTEASYGTSITPLDT